MGKFVEVGEESLRPLGPTKKDLEGVLQGPGLQEPPEVQPGMGARTSEGLVPPLSCYPHQPALCCPQRGPSHMTQVPASTYGPPAPPRRQPASSPQPGL